MQIRKAEKKDISQIVVIAKEEFGIDAWTENQFLSELEESNRIFLVAEDNGEILGYLTTLMLIDEMEILDIAVKNEHKRKHIASSLFEELFDKFGDIIKVWHLEIAEDNYVAHKLYEKYGFKDIAVRKNYYKSGKNAIIMQRKADE